MFSGLSTHGPAFPEFSRSSRFFPPVQPHCIRSTGLAHARQHAPASSSRDVPGSGCSRTGIHREITRSTTGMYCRPRTSRFAPREPRTSGRSGSPPATYRVACRSSSSTTSARCPRVKTSPWTGEFPRDPRSPLDFRRPRPGRPACEARVTGNDAARSAIRVRAPAGEVNDRERKSGRQQGWILTFRLRGQGRNTTPMVSPSVSSHATNASTTSTSRQSPTPCS